jgi:GntP family gluconate:H+ symporter
VTIASAAFSGAITAVGIKALYGAAMMHAGATVFAHLPHGSFFHATGGAVGMDFEARLKVLPYETATGFVLALSSTIIYGWLA